MLIQAFEWDDANREHVVSHGVGIAEVEEAALGRRHVRRSRNGCCVLYGQSDAGRYLFIVFAYKGQGIVRPFSARDMDEEERRLYRDNL